MNLLFVFSLMCIQIQPGSSPKNAGIFSSALWFLQSHGSLECSSARNDLQVKNQLAVALANDRELSLDEMHGLIAPEVFQKFAGSGQRLSLETISGTHESQTPARRKQLFPELGEHAAYLSTTFDMIDAEKLPAMDKLSDWIAKNWQADSPLQIITACTGNSRRSILSAAMGNLAAAYYGFDNVHFYSGGTTPSAFNPRTINTLKEIGFQIDPTGSESDRGEPQLPNPVYQIRWGDHLKALEFSKHYKHASNPQSGFATIVVCTEADTHCPIIEGASLRISMTFLDPKVYDDGTYEGRKYAERRDDIGRTLLAAMLNARRKIELKSSAD